MTDKRNNRKASTPSRIVLEHAASIATLSDRWFVSLAGGLGKLGGRVRREPALTATSPPRFERSEACSASSARRPGARFNVVPATRAESWSPLASGSRLRDRVADSESDREAGTPAEGTHAPGVLPLLQALGRVVAEHAGNEYRQLDEDERLWTLIRLLQALGAPGEEQRSADDEAKPWTSRQEG